MLSIWTSLLNLSFSEELTLYQTTQFFALTKFKAFANDKFHVAKNDDFCL